MTSTAPPLGAPGNCRNCQRSLERTAAIVCTECPPTYELCLNCFSSGVEVTPHRKDHKYRVRDNISRLSIFRDDWSAAEELLLLEAIEKHGTGNWKDIADHVGSKNERKCEEHYLDDYLGVFGAILPPMTLSGPDGRLVETDSLLPEADRLSTKRRKFNEDANTAAPAAAPPLPPGPAPLPEPIQAAAPPDTPPPIASPSTAASTTAREEEAEQEAREVTMTDAPAAEAPATEAAPTEAAPAEAATAEAPAAETPTTEAHEAQDESGKAGPAGDTASAPASSLSSPNHPVAMVVTDRLTGPNPAPGTVFQRERLRDKPKASMQQVQERIGKLPGASLVGFMPLRGDFDVEHDNDAEVILSEMEFSSSDSANERELKLQVLHIYNSKLDERERRKRFVIERGFLDYKQQQLLDAKRPRDERDLVARMRVFSRFHSKKEHEQFVEGILVAKRLRKRIAELQHYREMGIQTLREADEYEAERKRRDSDLALKQDQASNSYLFETGRAALQTSTAAGASLSRSSSSSRSRGGRRAQWDGGADDAAARQSTADAQADAEAMDFVASAPGAALLSESEKRLCASLRLLPKYYLVVKDALLRECFRLGYLTRTRALQLIKIDVTKSERIFDFFVSCGWVDVLAEEDVH